MPKAISSNQNDQDIEGQTNGKIKGKAEKKSVCSQPSSFIGHLKLIKLHCFCFNKFPTFFFFLKKKKKSYMVVHLCLFEGNLYAGGCPEERQNCRRKAPSSKKSKKEKSSFKERQGQEMRDKYVLYFAYMS